MNCKFCGNPIDPNWKICHHCGKVLKVDDNTRINSPIL